MFGCGWIGGEESMEWEEMCDCVGDGDAGVGDESD